MKRYTLQHGTETIGINTVSVDTRCADFTVNDDLSVDIRVPIGMNQEMLLGYLRMNRQKILQEYDRKKKRNHQALPVLLEMEEGHLLYRNGLKLPYLGYMNMELRLRYLAQGEGTDVYMEDRGSEGKRLTIRTENDDQRFLRYCIMRCYKKCAADIVRQKAEEYGNKLQLTFNHIQITGQMKKKHPGLSVFTSRNIALQNQNTLWGSCNRRKNLKFDWKLAMLPMEIIDYIIVHELTHLKKMNHSSAFWAEVEKVLPEYHECQEWLRKHGKEYEIF